MSYNDWLYAYGKPINLTDPSGQSPLATFANHNGNPPGAPDFSGEEEVLIEEALRDVADAYLRAYDPFDKLMPCWAWNLPLIAREMIKRPIANAVFYRIHGGGPITFEKWTEHDRYNNNPRVGEKTLGQDSNMNTIFIYKYGNRRGGYARLDSIDQTKGEITSQQYSYFNTYDDNACYKRFIVHEVGHAFNNAMDGAPAFLLGGQDWKDFLTPDVTVKNGFFDTQAQCWQRRGNALTVQDGLVGEIFADQFVGWVYEKWDLSNDDGLNLGQRRSDMMNGYMPMWIKQKLGLH